MVPVDSVEVPRDSTYSGYPPETISFRIRACHPLWTTFPDRSASQLFGNSDGGPYNPAVETTAVWAISLSLAATEEIDFSFFSCGYLDVSVLRVCHCSLWIQPQPVRESRDHHLFDGYPGLIAAFRALQSLLMPRHPPCALGSLTTRIECSQSKLFRRLATLRILAGGQTAAAPFGEVTFSLSIGSQPVRLLTIVLPWENAADERGRKTPLSISILQDANYHNQIVKDRGCRALLCVRLAEPTSHS